MLAPVLWRVGQMRATEEQDAPDAYTRRARGWNTRCLADTLVRILKKKAALPSRSSTKG